MNTKIRIKQNGGINLNISFSKFRRILNYLDLIHEFKRVDYIILTKKKEELPIKNRGNNEKL